MRRFELWSLADRSAECPRLECNSRKDLAMSERFCLVLLALLVLCLPVSIFADSAADTKRASANEGTQTDMSFWGVSVSGCFTSGLGDALCLGSVLFGPPNLNYWWFWNGPGNLYQDNTLQVRINDCLDAEGDLILQARDPATNEIRYSTPYRLTCDCSPGNPACAPPPGGDLPCEPVGFCHPGSGITSIQ